VDIGLLGALLLYGMLIKCVGYITSSVTTSRGLNACIITLFSRPSNLLSGRNLSRLIEIGKGSGAPNCILTKHGLRPRDTLPHPQRKSHLPAHRRVYTFSLAMSLNSAGSMSLNATDPVCVAFFAADPDIAGIGVSPLFSPCANAFSFASECSFRTQYS